MRLSCVVLSIVELFHEWMLLGQEEVALPGHLELFPQALDAEVLFLQAKTPGSFEGVGEAHLPLGDETFMDQGNRKRNHVEPEEQRSLSGPGVGDVLKDHCQPG